MVRNLDGDPLSIERGVRQRLADKISDTMVGLWLLVPEHLRLGTWDLLRGWTGQPTERIEPRLGLQAVHEAALCLTGLRERLGIAIRGFEILNGLPFLATDTAMHLLFDHHTVAQSQRLQVALGQIRRSRGHYAGKLLLLDPHRPFSYSRRHLRRHRKDQASKPKKTGQMFFCLDGDTQQPLCCTISTSARTVTQASPEILGLAWEILGEEAPDVLVAADAEHFTAELFDRIRQETPFELIVPIANQTHLQRQLAAISPEQFTRHWAGYATAVLPYTPHHSQAGPYYQLVQRIGERPDAWHFNAFLSTTDRDSLEALTTEYPKRWHLEEFFNANQALGWKRAGTLNLNIRYGQMTAALLAQAAIHQLRAELGEPYQHWDAQHLASAIFRGLEGDIRVKGDQIVVTYYNAPPMLREKYRHLPEKLAAENVDPRIPWLYNFSLDFRFK